MTTPIPPSGYPSDTTRTQSDIQTYLETMLSIQKEILGGTGEAASVELVSHSFTPGNNACICVIDTASMASSDYLDVIDPSNCRDGIVIYLRITNDGRVITVINGAGGTGQIFTIDGNNFVLESTSIFLALKFNESISAFEEMFRSTADTDWAVPGAIGSTTPNSGTFTSITLTDTVGAHEFLANTSSSSAAPAFTSITTEDLPDSVVTGVGADLSPLFSTSISSQNLEFTQSTASNGTLFGNFTGSDADPVFNDPGSADQILGVTHDGTGLEYKTLTAGDNITITPDVGTITIAATGGGGGALNNFTASAYPQNTDDSTEGYSQGSLWFYPDYSILFICTDPTEGAAVWQFLASPQISPANTPVASGLFNTGLPVSLLRTADDTTNPVFTPPTAVYINGQVVITNADYQNYSASSWTYDAVDVFNNVEHYTQDYDTDPPTLDPTYQVLFEKVVTDADGNITEIDNYGLFFSPTLLSYAQPIPTTTGLLLQTSSNPQGISYGPLELASIDPTGATANQLVGFDGTEFNLFYALNGVDVSTDTSTTLTAGAASVQSLDATGGSISITLPASSTCPGQVFYFANTASSGSNTVTVSLASGDVQVGAGDLTLNNGGVLGVVSDGTGNWIVISSL